MGVRTILPHPRQTHWYRDLFPDWGPSYPICPALTGLRKPQNCSYLWLIRKLSKPPLLLNPEPAPPSYHSPAQSCSRGPHFLPCPWGASLARGMPLLEAVIFSSLWACECPPVTSVYRRELRNSLLLPFSISFAHGGFSSWLAVGLGQGKLEQPEISISRARGKSAHVSCKMSTEVIDTAIHWYRQKPDQEIEHLTFVSTHPVRASLGGKSDKLEASKNAHTSTATLKINFLEQEDEAVYFCACWDRSHSTRVARRSCARTVLGSGSTHILLHVGNHRGRTARCPAGASPSAVVPDLCRKTL